MANNLTQLPYQACLVQNIPQETQHQLRDFTNYGVRPMGMLLAVIGFFCNALVVFTVTRNRSLQSPSFLMLCSLSVTDLLYTSYSIFRDVSAIADKYMCPPSGGSGVSSRLSHATSILCLYATLANLALISRDRYLAVRKPWWYRSNVTRYRAIVKILVTWVICILAVLLAELDMIPYGNFSALLFYLICFLVIIISYIGIFSKKMNPTETQLRPSLERERRIAITVGIILVVLFLTFLPALMSPLILHLLGIMSLSAYRPFYTFFLQLNAFLNPLLNFGRSKDMRTGLRKLIKLSRQIQPQAGSFNRGQNPHSSDSATMGTERAS